MSAIDFLKQGIKQVRKSIKDIDDSYNNDWDILAELCQNSVDAIRKSGIKEGTIEITINSQNKSISVKDNGVGISPSKLPELLAPFATDKEEDEDSVGEKGVGLTFALFTCNEFYIKSGNKDGVSEGLVFDAHNWKSSVDITELKLTHNKLKDSYQGTEVVLKKVSDTPLFQLSFNQLKFLIRTKTAIGSTNSIWDDDVELLVTLNYVNADGEKNSEELKFSYWLPLEGLNKNAIISIEEFNAFLAQKDRTDQEKRKLLKDKIIYHKGVYNHGGRSIKYFACSVPKRKTWDDLTVAYKICSEEQLNNTDWIEKNHYVTFHPGITTSVKGMPTGIYIEPPITGEQGSWARMFILFEDRHLKFDIGRKSIHGMTARLYKGYAREIFNEYRKLSKYISGDIIIDSSWIKEEIFAELDELLDLNADGIHLLKTPKDQEASVAGLFFECLGNGKIIGFKWLTSGYRNKYDLYAKIGKRNVILEFKSRLQNILKDFNDEVKMFDEIDCIVCWNVTEDDRQVLKARSIDVEEIEVNSLPGSTTVLPIPNSTHTMIYSGGLIKPIYVIDLKKILGI